MISGKGILFTVLGAAGAAVVAGTMLTGGQRGEKMRHMGDRVRNFIGSFRNKRLLNSPGSSHQRAEYNQAHDMGHA